MSSKEPFADFTEALAGTTNLLRLHMRQKFKECNVDITVEMLQVLRYLGAHDGVNQQEIANAVCKDKATLTSMIDNLVRRTLVQRHEDSQDRRSKRIVLTPQGWALQPTIEPWIAEMLRKAGAGIPQAHLLDSIALFKQISENLKCPGS